VREGGLLINLDGLDDLTTDPESQTATVRPGSKGRDLNRQLATEDLFFPTGHCPTIAVGGFLLQGGWGWLSRKYGPACTNVIGFNIAMAAVENGRLGVAARALGLAQDCLDRSVSYANERIVGGAPIARFQLVQAMITEMVVGTEGARAMILELAEARNKGLRARREASLAKFHASEVAMSSASSAVQIHGAYGVHEDYIVGKHFRDAKVFQIVEGQNQLHTGLIAEYELGIRSDVKR
jgi:FAD/FMN-containing dehydrogenase